MHFHDPNNSNDFRRLVDRRKIGFAQQRDTFQENLSFELKKKREEEGEEEEEKKRYLRQIGISDKRNAR